MIEYFSVKCNFACWECPRDCTMKLMMKNLPEHIFNKCVLDSMKSNAGTNIVYHNWNAQQANDYVVKSTVALSIARKKYLETLKNR